jgi:hypothetical protein
MHEWVTPEILATWEDRVLKPAWVNSSQDPILKVPNIKQSWWNGLSG